ncbi:threonine synthase [Natranaeroarchaeum sulfidigenes]|uniref:Threonine synthase and cysteate synthase n=1 Tax=Natranaeroarchaeum sulfidigenes TaxID=2784880 RepID=A0A897MRC2_9EURY|nr:threonine synthase [Natranaeroarchaeum sulfidigenes]QSG02558.1 Threonine synthase and cysteate synthase [Natranaeroarchaeum sulfidigenes]
METSHAFDGLRCLDCGETVSADQDVGRCPDCGGVLDPQYEYDEIDLDRETLDDRTDRSQWRYCELLPFTRESAVSLDEGGTPLVECPRLADELDVGRVLVKDDGRLPTGSTADRGQSLALTAATEADETAVALPSPGASAQSAAAYAARAGLDSHAFVPSRTPFTNKAMINVHGGDMNVIGGRFGDAVEAFEDAIAEESWHSLSAFDTPYRHEGRKTVLFEIVEQLDWTLPDAIVAPTGTGLSIAGLYKGARELRELGFVDDLPALYVAQAAGCAPFVEAWGAERSEAAPVELPDTICGELEIPDPNGSAHVLDALAATDGGAVSVEDPEILESAVTAASSEGLEVGTSTGAALGGTWRLAERDTLGEDDCIVVLNTGAGSKDNDVLRSHLMGQGI